MAISTTAIEPGGGASKSPVTRTHCPYCAFQCGMTLTASAGDTPAVSGDNDFPVNHGALCVKGWTAAELLRHPDRLTTPLARDADGELTPVSWEEALERVVEGVQQSQQRHGRDSVAVFGGGSLTNEKAYLLGKFARLALGTPNIDYNGRYCMSSAAAAGIRALGIDRGLPFPLEDIRRTDVVFFAGGNVAETMPPIMQYFEAQRNNGGQLIVADPRRTATAARASLHLQLLPGTDAALANGILHVLVREGLLDERFIDEHTEGFGRVRAMVSAYWPERVEGITGVPQSDVVRAARMIGTAGSAMVLTARGAEQQAQGVNNVLTYINIALATGRMGRPNSGYGCVTGQGNGQGAREHGQKADQLPGYRMITDPEARRHVAGVWGVDETELPGPGKSAYELLSELGTDEGARALLVFGSNVAVSTPNASLIEERLRSLDFLVVSDFFLSETAELADVVLPSAQWAEEEGTMTNLEGRVILRRRAIESPEGVRTDPEVICELARRLGRGQHFDYQDPRAVFDELRRASAGGPADYSGITYERITAENGVFWPCPSEAEPGLQRLFTDGRFPTASGRAQFHAVSHGPPAEETDAEYPMCLTTGRVLAQYQSGTQTRRVAKLAEMAPSAMAEISPMTAARYRVSDGDVVVVTSRRGSVRLRARVSRGIRRDTVFIPFHWGGADAVNRLTNPALDPVSRMPEFKVCAVRIEPAAPEGK